jgi:glycosyltransferase involved in cell wall biosynthesis
MAEMASACTIAAPNYLAQARVLARSFQTHHPNWDFTLLLLDPDAGSVDLDGLAVNVVTPYELGIEKAEVHRMSAIYDVTEMATAVKPWLLETLLAEHDSVLYFDPDIEIFDSLHDVVEEALVHGIALTPHTLQSLPRDGLQPTETLILHAGMFNLGFIGVSVKAHPFLGWWKERLARECVIEPESGRFVDQRWVDFVPVLFDHVVLRDPALNVAWWNLYGRNVHWNGRWEIDDRPIRFFHFSGFDPRKRRQLTKHADSTSRVRLTAQPGLRRLCDNYSTRLKEEGFVRFSKLPYRLATTSLGRPMSHETRARYRKALKAAEERGAAYPPDPFDADAKAAFEQWAGGTWAKGNNRPGVNFFGLLRAESGVGEAGRQLLIGVAEAGIPHSTHTYGDTVSRQAHQFDDVGTADPEYDFNVICVNADQLPAFAKRSGYRLFEDRYSIGVWFWEAPTFPKLMQSAFNFVDEVWVASDYIAAAILPETQKPVHVFPLPVVVPDVSALSRPDVGMTEDFTFLFVFDFLSVFARKNPLAVIEAFKLAFQEDDGPRLIVKSINGDRVPRLAEQVRARIGDRDDIRFVDDYLTKIETSAMIAMCDCYVSLHRSEGFGFTMAEAMAHGRPVIGTGYGGNLTFMDEANSFLVPYRLVTIGHDAPPYPAGAKWAEPDIQRSAELMRFVFENPVQARERALRGQASITSRHTPSEAGRFVAARLAAVRSEFPEGRFSTHVFEDPLIRAEIAVGEGPGGSDFPDASSRGGPSGLVRRGLRRALWPVLKHQHDVDQALVGAVGEMEEHGRRLELALSKRLDALEAEVRSLKAEMRTGRRVRELVPLQQDEERL